MLVKLQCYSMTETANLDKDTLYSHPFIVLVATRLCSSCKRTQLQQNLEIQIILNKWLHFGDKSQTFFLNKAYTKAFLSKDVNTSIRGARKYISNTQQIDGKIFLPLFAYLMNENERVSLDLRECPRISVTSERYFDVKQQCPTTPDPKIRYKNLMYNKQFIRMLPVQVWMNNRNAYLHRTSTYNAQMTRHY